MSKLSYVGDNMQERVCIQKLHTSTKKAQNI